MAGSSELSEFSFSGALRIATRSSQLAMWQAQHVAGLITARFPDVTVELVDVTTRGDADQTQPLWTMGGTGVFTREVQRTVLAGAAELAVHSLKDLPTEQLEPELTLAAVPEREIRWDALVLAEGSPWREHLDPSDPLGCLPTGARIGSGSLRRRAQIARRRPDLELQEIRGNLNTRLRKLDEGEYDALILAAAGLLRLEWDDRLTCLLQPPQMYPAVGQGALGLECRVDDSRTRAILDALNDVSARLCTQAERRLLASLRAGCHAPVGVDCQYQAGELQLTAVILTPDGHEQILASGSCQLPADLNETSLLQAEELGQTVAAALIEQGGHDILAR